MAKSDNLRKARAEKQDEFYTQITDIENELKHYKEQFRDKTIFCNCDDPYESNFFKYFAINFDYLGLKKLIATCYDGSPIAYTQLNLFGDDRVVPNNNHHPYKIEINEIKDYNHDGATDLADVEYLLKNKKNSLTILKDDGDFRSSECVELLKQADIVVTNPPFSLFREYVSQLIEYNKKFLIIGNQNAVAYKEIFPLLRDNKIWLGYNSGSHTFQVPHTFERNNTFIKDGIKYAKFGNICWFTNLDTSKRNEDIVMYKSFNKNEYPKYENYNAINVDKTTDIPYDYYDIMGVPITFLDRYNPNQFVILGLGSGYLGQSLGITGIPKEHKKLMKGHSAAGDLYYLKNGKPIVPYSRILIRRKTNENRT